VSLPHVLLGLLADQPATGYDLERRMRVELDPLWRAEFSQIYPELARLRRAGHVVLRVLGPRRGPRRNRYRITAAGRRELKRWLVDAAAPSRGRDDLLVRIALFEALPPNERRDALFRAERAIGEEISRLRTGPALEGFRREARRGAIEKLEASRRWLKSIGPAAAFAGSAVPLSKKK